MGKRKTLVEEFGGLLIALAVAVLISQPEGVQLASTCGKAFVNWVFAGQNLPPVE